MSVVLNPNKSFFSTKITFVEQKNGVFRFFQTPLDVEKWGKETQSIIASWKRLTWSDQNLLYSRSIYKEIDSEGEAVDRFNPVLYRDLKLRLCLKKWDAVDDNGSLIPLCEDTFDNIDAGVAQALLDSFEEEAEPSADDLNSLERVALDWFKGKTSDKEHPELKYIYEHLIAKHYGWDEDKIRGLDYYDFQAHLRISMVREQIDREFRMNLAGIRTEGQKMSGDEVKDRLLAEGHGQAPGMFKKGSGPQQWNSKKNLVSYENKNPMNLGDKK